MTTNNAVLLEKKDNIATLTLNQPDNRNALSLALLDAFEAAVNELKKDKDARVLVLTGSGKAFSSGGDVKEMSQQAQMTMNERREQIMGIYRKGLCFLDLQIPVIAAINGHAAGAGCTLALACDMRVMNEEAKLGLGFVKIGLHPGMGSCYFLPRIVGMAKAYELLFTGDMLHAKEAEVLGIVNKAVPSEKLQEETLAFAKKIADGPPIAIRMAKKAIQQSLDATLESILDYEAFAQAIISQTEDVMEGIMSFIEKRPPKFKGK